ncbi:flagellar basal body L-ring protein FlgH [Acuticoccus sp.]|uniref:flagellar basal body L-ring protein FlgH n=1 Tax=Acuticoccus sp. TaxID=1904378 RepID=UPI003B52598C
MTRIRSLIVATAPGLALAGCVGTLPLVEPPLSPIGDGLSVHRTALPATVDVHLANDPSSLYGRRSRELLTDVRAGNVGDTVTIVIQLDERAEFENESERERRSDAALDFNIFARGRGFDGPEGAAEAEADGSVGSSSRYRGTGAIDRSERLSLRVAALVIEVLPNGNLVIAGSQEIRVNDEVRVLRVAGIVNPLDVTRNNDVDYARIAEARVSYGGRGRQSEVQSPNWGQQLYDRVVPF